MVFHHLVKHVGEFFDFRGMGRIGNKVLHLVRIGFQIVQLAGMSVGLPVAVRIANLLPLGRAYGADVRRIRELSFVIVLVKER